MTDSNAGSQLPPALRLLQFEQSEFERFLHDELGQSLVALRSMAAALGDGADSEIVELVSLTANDTYAEVYDRMTELRAEALALEADFAGSLHRCLDDARLEARNLVYRVQSSGDGIDDIDPINRRLLLRGLRCLVNALKRAESHGDELVVAVVNEADGARLSLQLHPGGFPAALLDHPYLARLAARLGEFGGGLDAPASGAEGAITLRLPARPAGGW